jgi:hypothetical protein
MNEPTKTEQGELQYVTRETHYWVPCPLCHATFDLLYPEWPVELRDHLKQEHGAREKPEP